MKSYLRRSKWSGSDKRKFERIMAGTDRKRKRRMIPARRPRE